MSSESKEDSKHTVSNRVALLSVLTGKISIRPLYQYLWLMAATVSAFYGVIFLLNSLGIEFLALMRGQGIAKFLVNIVIFGWQIDLAIFGVSLLLASASFFLLSRGITSFHPARMLLIVPLLFTLFAAVEVGSVIRWIEAGFVAGAPFANSSWNISLLEMQFANVFYGWIPRIMLLFLFAWVLRILFNYYWPSVVKVLAGRGFVQSHREESGERSDGKVVHPKILLAVGLTIALFVAVYPYLPSVNPNGTLIGVDTPYYLEKLNQARGSTVFDALAIAFADDRMGLHLLTYSLAFVIQDVNLVMKVLPVILALSLTISTFFVVKASTENLYLSGLSALLTPIAFQQIVGMNAGFYANWLALIEANLLFGFLFIALKTEGMGNYIAAMVLSVFVLFIHPWTWFVIMATLSIFLFVGFVTKSSNKRERLLILAMLAINIVADVTKGALFPLAGAGSQAFYGSVIPLFKIADLPNILGVLRGTVNTFLGGVFHSFVLLLLSVVGFLTLGEYKTHFNRFLLSLAIAGLVGVFFFSSNFEMYLQARALYVVPFPIFAALGLIAMSRFLKRLSVYAGMTNSYSQILTAMLVISAATAMLNHTLRMASTIYPYVV